MENYFSYLDPTCLREIAEAAGTPLYVYSEARCRESVEKVLAFPNAFGLTVRYALKANPNAAFLHMFNDAGIHFDASSGYEVKRALAAGIRPDHIQLTAQEYSEDISSFVKSGVLFNATSLNQLEWFGRAFPGREISIRLNPGVGSGHNNRTNVGGRGSSFGIWREYLSRAAEIARSHRLTVRRLHSHIGSGSDPEVWERAVTICLEQMKQFPDADTLNMGGGFKIARQTTEKTTDLQVIGESGKKAFEKFHEETGRKIHLEIEPGTYLVGPAGFFVTSVHDKNDTGPEGYTFLKLNGGMNDMTRQTLYGALHPVKLYPAEAREREEDVLIVGHCCESGDKFTPEPGNPEGLLPLKLPEAKPGDLLVFAAAGAYCSSMSLINYNSFPRAAEVMLTDKGPRLIRKRQRPDDIYRDECNLPVL